ncbi:unnamed protein product [Linum tenue]|uniref:Uncharacterized protein n=1 Tax=Linum tenue TaxID=586396 RepID=A0AAV0LKP5_9ROSI|nr:unnamed protein product [Linum tenue]
MSTIFIWNIKSKMSSETNGTRDVSLVDWTRIYVFEDDLGLVVHPLAICEDPLVVHPFATAAGSPSGFGCLAFVGGDVGDQRSITRGRSIQR